MLSFYLDIFWTSLHVTNNYVLIAESHLSHAYCSILFIALYNIGVHQLVHLSKVYTSQ